MRQLTAAAGLQTAGGASQVAQPRQDLQTTVHMERARAEVSVSPAVHALCRVLGTRCPLLQSSWQQRQYATVAA
jgi:hypothetical protein